MKKNIKVGIIFVIILSLLVGGLYLILINKNEKLNVEERLNDIIDLILSEEIKVLSDSEEKKLEEYVSNTLKTSINNKVICKSYFILGYINANNLKYDVAIELLNKAIPLLGNIYNSEVKAHTYYELSKIYLKAEEYNKSTAFFHKMIEVCEMEDIRDEIVELSIDRCNDLYLTPGGLKKSIELMEETLSLARELKCTGVVDAYYKLGVLYDYDNRSVEAINCKLEALRISEENGLRKKALEINTDIGVNYLYVGNFNEAVKYFKKVISSELEDEAKEAETKSIALLYLTESFSSIGDYESANICLELLDERIYQITDRIKREDCIIYMCAIKADLESRKGNPKEALRLLHEAKSRFDEKGQIFFNNFDIKIIEEFGDGYYALADYETALKYHKEAQELAKQRNLVYLESVHNEKLYFDYKELGDDKNTIKYLEQNNELQKKIKNNQDTQYSQFLITKFEKETSMKKISQLESQKDIMNYLIIGLVIITIIIVLFSCFIFKKNKEISRLNKLFKNLSVTDGLTKLPNRRALDEYLAGKWSLYQKTYMPISFVMMDIDYFKNYNDNYGHPEGDKVLEEIAASIDASCRNSDFVARYGGEEFIIIMLNTDRHEAINVVQRIQEDIYKLNIKHEYSEVSDRISLSIGISTAYVGSAKDYDEYIKRADIALYKAKESGKNTYFHLGNDEKQ